MYPNIENDPGIVCTPATFKNRVENIGSKVITKAGIIGSEKSFEIKANEMNVPKLSIIDM
jgi:hypothetical protein